MLARYMLQIKDVIKIKTKRNIFVVSSEMPCKTDWEKGEQRGASHRAQQARSLGVPYLLGPDTNQPIERMAHKEEIRSQ